MHEKHEPEDIIDYVSEKLMSTEYQMPKIILIWVNP